MKGITTKKSKRKHGTLKYKPNISLEHFTAICAWFPHQDENKIRTQCANPTKPRGHQHFLTNTEIIPVQWVAGVKKSPRLSPRQSTKGRSWPAFTRVMVPCVRMGQGFRGFLGLRERSSLIQWSVVSSPSRLMAWRRRPGYDSSWRSSTARSPRARSSTEAHLEAHV